MKKTSYFFFATLLFPTFFNASNVAAAPYSVADDFPIRLGEQARSYGMSYGNFDSDKDDELVVITGNILSIINLDGSLVEGFPIELKEPEEKTASRIIGAPTVCDLNKNGQPEIIVGTLSGNLYAIDGTGHLLDGFPVKLKEKIQATPFCADFDQNGGVEILVPTLDGQLHWIESTGKKRPTKIKVGQGIESGAVLLPSTFNGKQTLVLSGGDGRLHQVNVKGQHSLIPDFKSGFRVTGTIAIGDVNDDGLNELIFGNNDFNIYAVDLKGKVLKGFPFKTGYRIYGSPALADINNDGVLEIIIASGDGYLYVLDGQGQLLWKNKPLVGSGTEASPVVADLNGDGQLEIIQAGADGKIYIFNKEGANFVNPLNCNYKFITTPLVGDFNHDGKIELAAVNQMSELYLFSFEKSGNYSEQLLPWPAFGHDAAHSGRFHPNPSRFKHLLVAPTMAYTTNDLKVSYEFFDLDGDQDQNTQIRWYKNGLLQADFNNQSTIPARVTKKHDIWHYTLQAHDNYAKYGEENAASNIFTSEKHTILNTIPTKPILALKPEKAFTTDEITVDFLSPSTDADGDQIVYRYSWLNGSKVQKLPNNTDKIAPMLTHKNELWTAVVTPFDGEQEGTAGNATLFINNSLPQAPIVTFNLEKPPVTAPLESSITTPSNDNDNDKISYQYKWWLNDELLNLPSNTKRLPAGPYKKGQKITLEVTPWDDQEAGATTTISATYQNSLPEAAKIAILPLTPLTDDALRLVLSEAVHDDDDDMITYEHHWEKTIIDGSSYDGTSFYAIDYGWDIPASATKRGERWRVRLIPHDGESLGPVTTAEVTIGNSRPIPPVVAIDNHHPTTDMAVTSSIVKMAQDLDGDSLTISYRWFKDGQEVTIPGETNILPASQTSKHQKWTLKTYASDDELTSKAHTLDFTISNSAPSVPGIALTNYNPRSSESSTVNIIKASTDIDQDKLSYHYRWWRNNELQTELPLDQKTLPASLLTKGDHWRVEVRAFDQETESLPAYEQLLVRNTIPPAPKVTLLPEKPTTIAPLTCQVELPTDLDNDQLSTEYHWYRNDKEVIFSTERDTLPARLTHKGEKWQCQALVRDDEENSPRSNSQILTIANTAPTAPEIIIEPNAPGTLNDLHCSISKDSFDPDNDLITYKFSWLKNGQALTGKESQMATIPAQMTKRGETWSCQVTAYDQEISGPSATAEVTIANGVPTMPRITIEPANPAPGQDIVCKITEDSRDDDNDKITYLYNWIADGVPMNMAKTTNRIGGEQVFAEQVWQCQVTPTDGQTKGPTASSTEVMVRQKW